MAVPPNSCLVDRYPDHRYHRGGGENAGRLAPPAKSAPIGGSAGRANALEGLRRELGGGAHHAVQRVMHGRTNRLIVLHLITSGISRLERILCSSRSAY